MSDRLLHSTKNMLVATNLVCGRMAGWLFWLRPTWQQTVRWCDADVAYGPPFGPTL